MEVTQGQLMPQRFLLPLKTIPAFDYFCKLRDTMKKYSWQGNKAETLLSFMGVILSMLAGGMPLDAQYLQTILPNIGRKKQQLY